ncbi:TorD/DmsD family molecular chaperone [Sulfitobacter donghicola]|uniref:Molecular chaperone TorD n=1 Tax=Sulfitobacter donghicola DSW-25 = KCTC 12864 = JCM 14565 TaxID=1300350 RepID=A0A073IGH2_9RHOB|nr:molecular chaperone TorD family protein [Sulfitobacter donghicola]KEJ88640.1 molecular chaperone TorD [Sulfitobacter donghicola DSW-25 = KCTC 12864 = JCM 14565]KIN68408.1 Cytoplasmic chaperone TorD [Sulfitobacter donghicola DSW-25 = KCTC 12864 = JCM 14565]
MNNALKTEIAEEDRLRADLYNFLGVLLSGPPDDNMLAMTAGLSGDDSPLGSATTTLAKMAKLSKAKAVTSEYNKLFIGLGRGELLPYASYYLTGFLNEKPLARLRDDMVARGLERADSVFEPEDNIASLMEMMGAMIVGRFGTAASLEQQKTFFNTHIAPWAAHFYSDLEGAKNSVFYASVATVGRTFMEIESEAFRMSAG